MAAISRAPGPSESSRRSLESVDEGKLQMVRAGAEAVQNTYNARNEQFKEIRQHRYRQVKVTIPEAYQGTTKQIRLPLIRDAIDLMATIINRAEPRFHVDPYAGGPNATA